MHHAGPGTTHIITDEKWNDELNALEKKCKNAVFVTSEWALKSIRDKQLADENEFRVNKDDMKD